MSLLTTLDALHAHYGTPGEASLIKESDHLTPAYRRIVEAARFCALATCGPEGLDCSPRGDKEPIVRIQDARTLLLPDRRGNDRIDSLRNIVRDPRVSLMLMVPGWNNVLRINGEAVLSADPDLLASFETEGKKPRCVVIVTIDTVYFQCARAIMRADLWNPDAQVNSADLPTPGMIMQEIKEGFDGGSYDAQWPERARKSMW
ncbi:MAG: pyridoxamine 5'-phosphate oxidase family protein [Roseibium sp.]